MHYGVAVPDAAGVPVPLALGVPTPPAAGATAAQGFGVGPEGVAAGVPSEAR